MLNKSTSSSKYVVQSGVTQYPIGFEFQYNGNDTPQIRVTIGAMVAEENLHFVISEDLLTINLIPLEEEAPVDPNDYSWMDKWVGMELVIERDIPFVQESDYQLGRISPERIEKDFDLSVMRDQILADRINEHIEDVQGEVDALHSRIDSVQEEHESDMAAVDSRIDSVQEEHESDIAAIDSRIDYVQEEHELDMYAVDEVMATKATKAELENAKATLSAGLERNAQAIQETRDDMNAKDSQLEATLDSHTGELTTLHGQVSGIESKIPESASVSNQLATKADLAAGLDDYVKKSGDTMTGLLTIQSEEDYDLSTPPVGGLSFKSNASPDGFTNRMRQVGNGFIAIEYLLNGKPYSNLVFGDQGIYVANTENGTGNPVSLGTSGNPWDNVYAKKLNNGADLNIPTKGGTLARLEDLGDYLPLTGGTLTGVSSGSYAFARILTFQSVSEQGEIYGTYSIGVSTEGFALDGAALYEVGIIVPKTNGRYSLGSRGKGFLYVNTQKLYNGADLAVPTEGGTLARIEDIDAVVGDISTALTAILGE